MQYNNEQLIVTYISIPSGHAATTLTHLNYTVDSLQHADGFLSSQLYRGYGRHGFYLLCSVWESDTSWAQAQAKYNPQKLISIQSDVILSSEQWQLQYLWGYYRPLTSPTFASAHLAFVPAPQLQALQKKWLNCLQHHTLLSKLSFSFLAHEYTQHKQPSPSQQNAPSLRYSAQTLLFNLLTWDNEQEQRAFYAHKDYQWLKKSLEEEGNLKILSLEML